MTSSTRSGAPNASVRAGGFAAVLAGAAACLTAAAGGSAADPRSVSGAQIGALLVVLTVAGTLQLQIRNSDDVDATDLFDVALAPVLLVLSPPLAVLVTVVAKAISQAVLRVRPVKTFFNTAQWACAAATGVLVLAMLRPRAQAGEPAELIALAVALVSVAAVNHLAVAAVVRLVASGRSGGADAAPAADVNQSGEDPAATAAGARANRSRLDADVDSRLLLDGAVFAVNLFCGVLLAAAYLTSPTTLLLALLPLIVLHRAQRLAAARAADLARVDELRAASRSLLVDDPREALPSFLRRIRSGLGAATVELVLAEGDGRRVRRVTGDGSYREWYEDDDTISARLLEIDEVVLAPPDVPSARLPERLRSEGHQNVLAAPMEQPCRGVLCVYDRTGLRGFGANLRQVFDLLSRELAGALVRGDVLRQAESERARFAALVRGSSDLVLVLDPHAVVRYASPAALRVLGREAGSLTGRPLVELFSDQQAAAIKHWLTATVTDPAAILPLDLELPVPGQLSRHIQAISRNLLDDGAVDGVVVNVRDVSESRRAQALMQRQAQVLELIAADAPLAETLELVSTTVQEFVPHAYCHLDVAATDTGTTATDRARAVLGSELCARFASEMGTVMCDVAQQRTDGNAQVLITDLAADRGVLSAELQACLLHQGIAACWAWPLVGSGERGVGGSLGLLFEQARQPTEGERRLVDLAAKLAANAVNRSQERKQLAYQATHDALTGLASRTVLRDHIQLALARKQRSPATVAVLFADLDNLKIINDSLGHRVGDALLREVSRRLLGLVRPGDTVARLGGDEFVLLCGELPNADGARAVAERVLRVLSEAVRVDGHEFFVTSSLGIALATGSDQEPDLLLENADAAMYRAKERGGNQYRLFDETMRTAAARRLSTRTSMRQALDGHEFQVHYQPTVDLNSGRISGVEALVRWDHPSRGLLMPAQFIPLAEETGMIVPLGALVLVESCRQVALWSAGQSHGPLELAVNLSPRQFTAGGLVAMVEAVLHETGLAPGLLSLEITEGCLMDDALEIRKSLADLKRVGVRLAIDDFGTGYSSLSYLKNLPVDTLKLDQSFVRNVAEAGPDRAIAEMVMRLGQTLGLRTVAEGIETDRQLQTMQSLGCDVGQGFFLGHPVPSEQLVLEPALRHGARESSLRPANRERPADPPSAR